MAESELIVWAEGEAGRLVLEANSYDSYEPTAGSVEAHGKVSGALEFLRLYAPGSAFEERARTCMTGGFAKDALIGVARCLEQWATMTRNGLVAGQPYEVRARVEAATDLMEQVQSLLSDAEVHPAAPIVLAGAALEELLRSMIEAGPHEVKGKAGLNAYATALQLAGDLNRQEHKDVTSWAGLRNDAAHGRFDGLSRARAQLMVDGVNSSCSGGPLPQKPHRRRRYSIGRQRRAMMGAAGVPDA